MAFSLTAKQILRSSNKRGVTHTSTLRATLQHQNAVMWKQVVFSASYMRGEINEFVRGKNRSCEVISSKKTATLVVTGVSGDYVMMSYRAKQNFRILITTRYNRICMIMI